MKITLKGGETKQRDHPVGYVIISDKQEAKLRELRKKNSQEIEENTILQREAAAKKDFETARFFAREILAPLKSRGKVIDLLFFLLIDGLGKIPELPWELEQHANTLLWEIDKENIT